MSEMTSEEIIRSLAEKTGLDESLFCVEDGWMNDPNAYSLCIVSVSPGYRWRSIKRQPRTEESIDASAKYFTGIVNRHIEALSNLGYKLVRLEDAQRIAFGLISDDDSFDPERVREDVNAEMAEAVITGRENG